MGTLAVTGLLTGLALIVAGTAGIGAVVQAVPWLLEALRWAGALYLFWFAVSSASGAMRRLMSRSCSRCGR